jgi:hypothetical protein
MTGNERCSEHFDVRAASWSKGRSDRYAYYHCRGGKCRAVTVTKTQLEGLFAEELERLQPTEGYMRLLKDSVLQVWRERKAAVRAEVADVERRVAAIRQKLDQLDDAFLFAKTIDIETYDRHRERLRGELTLAQIDRHSSELEEFDVEGILAFAERVLPRASDMWIQASLDQRQRLQQLFFLRGSGSTGRGLFEPG